MSCETNVQLQNWCLLLVNSKMSITISNQSFIWKYHRQVRKSQNNAAKNQIIMKTLTRGVWPSSWRGCRWIGRFLVQTLIDAWPGLGTQPCIVAHGDLRVETWIHLVLTLGEWHCPLYNGPKKMVRGPVT